jgi:hypothetical protein
MLVVWPAIAIIIGTQNHIYQTALHLTFPDIPTAWSDSFRFPLVECVFWALLTPAILWLSNRYPIFSARWASSIGPLLTANLGIELLHAVYRTPLHAFVYPRMAIIPFPRLLRYYLAGNALLDGWVFWSIVVIAQFACSYTRQAEREKELATAQLQTLAAQLQPHFFFNVLNSVSALMRHDPEKADEMIGRLGDLIRTTLNNAPAEVPLRQELAVVRNYVEIERMRFLDRLAYSVHAREEVLDAGVPPLFLLPIVENAVRYAIAPRSEGGRIDVEAVLEEETVAIRIKDNGPGHHSGPYLREGIGMSNTRLRLQKHYSGAATFFYRDRAPGFEVEFRLPYRSAENRN